MSTCINKPKYRYTFYKAFWLYLQKLKQIVSDNLDNPRPKAVSTKLKMFKQFSESTNFDTYYMP